MKHYVRAVPGALPLLIVAAATAFLLAGDAGRSRAVQNPTIHLDMLAVGTTYDEFNTMTVGSVDSASSSSVAGTHSHTAHLVIKDVEDLVGFQVRLHYIGDRMRPWQFNPFPFNDFNLNQGVSFLNLPIDAAIAAHRGVTPAVSIPFPPPPDGSNTPQTALIGAAYDGSQTFAVSPDTPHKSVPDDASYDAPRGGVLGNLRLEVTGNECAQPAMFMDLDDGVPNSPGSQTTIFTGTGTMTIDLTESQLFDGTHIENCTTPLDSDLDGWTDSGETVIGTYPFNACPDDASDDAWPADINNNTFSDTADISYLTAYFGRAVPPAPARADIGPDPPNGSVDTADIARMTAVFGRGCAPAP